MPPSCCPRSSAMFRKSFPRVQVELNCSLSTPLVGCVKRGEVDIALVTRMNDFTGGQVVRQEQLIWMTGEQSTAHNEKPIPLALLPPGNIYRDHAIERLETSRACDGASPASARASADCRPRLSPAWRSPCSVAARWSATCARSARTKGLPPLPKVDLLLYKSPARHRRPRAPCTIISRTISTSTTNCCSARSFLCRSTTTARAAQGIRGRNWAPGPRPLERGGDAEDRPLVEPGRDDLKPDRKPVRDRSRRESSRPAGRPG